MGSLTPEMNLERPPSLWQRDMAPAKGRFAERLLAATHMPRWQLIELAAQACHALPDARRYADARLAHYPLPEEKRDAVLLSPDLVPQLFAALDLEDCAAATVCKAWSVAWTAKTRRVLRPAPLPELDFNLGWPTALAALPGGERMAIATSTTHRVRIVDKQMRLQHTLGDEASGVTFGGDVQGLAAGDGGLYVAEDYPGRLRRFHLDTSAVAAERLIQLADADEYYGFKELALAPGGPLFVVAQRGYEGDDDDDELHALDALTLELRFKVVLGAGMLFGLAVCGDEVFVGNRGDGSIRVLSLAGEPRRIIAADGWRGAISALCCVAERLCLVEMKEIGFRCDDPEEDTKEQRDSRMAGRRVFAFTPEGVTLQVYNSPRPLHEAVEWSAMCHFNGKLVVGGKVETKIDVDDLVDFEVTMIALQGL